MTMSGTKEDRTTSPTENQAKEDILSKQSNEETSDGLDVTKVLSTKKEKNRVETTGSEQEKEVNEHLPRKIETSEAEKDDNTDDGITEKPIKQDNPAERITAEPEPIEKQHAVVEQDRTIAKDAERQKSEDQPGQTVSKDDSQNLSNNSEKDQSKQTIMKNNGLQEVLNNMKTNDSPIQAVNELTDVKSFTVEWRPTASTHCMVADRSIPVVTENNSMKSFQEGKAGQISAIGSYVLESKALNHVNGSQTQASGKGSDNSGKGSDKVKQANLTEVENLVLQESFESSSILEQTVGKLKVSKINGTMSTAPEGISSVHTPAKVPLPSSAPPDYLKELLLRSQLNRRKTRGGLNEMSFVPKRSPPPIFRSRRGRPIRRPNMPIVTQFDPNFVVVTSAGVFSTSAITSAGCDVSPDTTSIANQKLSSINQLSSNESYFINRQPLRKIVPKIDATTHVQPLSLTIEPTTPPTSVTRPIQQLPVTSPIARPLESPSTSPNLEIDELHSNSPNDVATSTDLQDQPLDLCTKNNSADSKRSSIQAPTSQDSYDENEPLNLSKNRSLSDNDNSSSPNMQHLPRPEGLVGFWKTPPRSTFREYRKPGETGSPLEGDTASDTAANSPGLDNQTMPYGIFMSPNMNYAHGVVPLGPVSPTNRFLPEGFPEGAMILPGSPHYRLSHTMALQHNEPPTPERPYMCEECGATFKRNKSLKQHHRVHTSERPFKCGDCDKNFRYSSTLKQHEKIHTGMKPHTCEVCPRRFAHAEKLKRHVRIHSGEKPYICENEHCGKRFTDSSQLKLHMRTHSNHKPFACHYCPLRFKYSGDVKRHVRIHTGEKPYVCGYCKMRFTQSNTLKQHERTHTGERPYHCHKCGMTFTQSGSLKYHLAHRHPPDLAAFIITTNSPAVSSASSSVAPQLSINSAPQLSINS